MLLSHLFQLCDRLLDRSILTNTAQSLSALPMRITLLTPYCPALLSTILISDQLLSHFSSNIFWNIHCSCLSVVRVCCFSMINITQIDPFKVRSCHSKCGAVRLTVAVFVLFCSDFTDCLGHECTPLFKYKITCFELSCRHAKYTAKNCS